MTDEPQREQLPDEGKVDLDTEPVVTEDERAGGHVDAPRTDTAQADTAPETIEEDPRVAELTTDLQRLQAEYVNYKRRVDRDRELVQENARLGILSALMPVLDDLDRAREHGELEGGFKAVADSLERIVAGQGLQKFGVPGDEFDPRYHEALTHGHSPDVTRSTCQVVVQAGYMIGDRVVRPALVTVVDPMPEHEADETEDGPGPGTFTGRADDRQPETPATGDAGPAGGTD